MAAAHGSRPDFDALSLPDPIVTVTRAHQSMGNLMQDRIANLFRGIIAFHEVNGQLDYPPVIDAQAERCFATIEVK